ncbi:PREDICTED: cytoplasmic dynein 2 light intermediate chain 1-like [Branchiostoma belcheri]|uniref:Cytoplasmic dynein 2 light intermediate chain 1 n=1 Tax=Branchiostoma belcheri TaxID=7741 RepID=A0A6P4ZUF1_BRABE|nr:PREDICTED: cytoplasmic dynein 2 light intermediate chain 1-like [Branchiostoma belcheri]
MSKGDSIWDLAIEVVQQQEKDGKDGQQENRPAEESSVLLMGSKTSAKDVVNIWELGGGTFLSRLVDTAINVNSVRTRSMCQGQKRQQQLIVYLVLVFTFVCVLIFYRDSIWDLAIEVVQQQEKDGKDGQQENRPAEESSVLLMGSKTSGKTSIILRFLDRDEAAKPTTALEFTFGRRARNNLAKDVVNIWELGGGTFLSRLVDTAINVNSVRQLGIMLVLDLSRPEDLWVTMETLLKQARAAADRSISELDKLQPGVKQALRKKAWEKYDEHPDKDMVDPFPIPLVIVGGKYDVFQVRAYTCCFDKPITHHPHLIHYPNLCQFFSLRMKQLIDRGRVMFNHLSFGAAPPQLKAMQLEHNKPIYIPAAADGFQQIGPPPLPEGNVGTMSARNPVELWKQAFTGHFPQVSAVPTVQDDPAKDPQFAESSIDAMRQQKDEELERYRKNAERKAREIARMRDGLKM